MREARMDRWTDGRTGGRVDRSMDLWIYVWIYGGMEVWRYGSMEVLRYGGMHTCKPQKLWGRPPLLPMYTRTHAHVRAPRRARTLARARGARQLAPGGVSKLCTAGAPR